MRRIVIIASSMAGVACATHVKLLCPQEEIILVIPEEAKSHLLSLPTGPVGKRIHKAHAPLLTLEAQDMAVLETSDINLDTEEGEVSIFSTQGCLNIKYTELAIEASAKARIPRAIQAATNCLPGPLEGFSVTPITYDSLFTTAATTRRPILVVGGTIAAYETIFLALDAGAPVLWANAPTMHSAPVDPHMASLALQKMGRGVSTLDLSPEEVAAALRWSNDKSTVTHITVGEDTPLAIAGVIWASNIMAAHPIIRKDGFSLHADGSVIKDAGAPENIFLFGSGAALPTPGRTTAPVFSHSIGSCEHALSTALDAAARIGGTPTHTDTLDAAGASSAGMRLYRAGLTETDAEASGVEPDHATMGVPRAWLSNTDAAPMLTRQDFHEEAALCLTLVADKKNGKLLGVQVLSCGESPDGAEPLFASLTMAIRNGITIPSLLAQISGGATGALVYRCAASLEEKRKRSFFGITPDELLASRAAGADFFFLDVQRPEIWKEKKIQDSYNIPLHQLKKRSPGEIPRMVPLVIASASGDEAVTAATILQGFGAKDLYILDGGTVLWPYAFVREQL